MRIHEIQTIKSIKPLTPAQAKIKSLKQNVDNSKTQLQAERDRQHRQREAERQRKQLQRRNAQG